MSEVDDLWSTLLKEYTPKRWLLNFWVLAESSQQLHIAFHKNRNIPR